MSSPEEPPSRVVLVGAGPDHKRPEEMQFEAATLEGRKILVRNIISSFDPWTLPTEFRPEVYERITQGQSRRTATEWTVRDDLHATLMQWGSHDVTTWTLLRRMMPRDLALGFRQKLRRRFDEQFDRYDNIVKDNTGTELQAEMTEIRSRLHHIVRATANEASQGNITMVFLGALEKVCDRVGAVAGPARPRGRLPTEDATEVSNDGVPTLHHGLVEDGLAGFTLDILDTFLNALKDTWPGTLATREAADQLARINAILHGKVALRDYLTRFRALLDRVRGQSFRLDS
ncbi:uncharacterized protein PV07_12872 [Cladophialophora immunda]|uniref:Uncharacterized protein n=1 Tax=Cladophialophora immunda TaxID=569365 RepID=A0A0D2BTE8_9EURO|nr:uncharacterized protein PV07_12872 [Cladophialophora immunda]KIW21695.1 hypothetical protein PV07_12872 [Cladophialophora immunda]